MLWKNYIFMSEWLYLRLRELKPNSKNAFQANGIETTRKHFLLEDLIFIIKKFRAQVILITSTVKPFVF